MGKKGFTLVELLVASSIMAVLLGGVYLAFSTGLFGYKDIVSGLEYDAAAGRILFQMAHDLRNIVRYSDADTGFRGDAASVEFFSLIDTHKSSISFRQFARLRYANKEGRLIRFIKTAKEAIRNNPAGAGEDMQLDAKSVSFSYGSFDEARDTINWLEKWDNLRQLPSAVRLKLLPHAKSGTDYEISVYLPQ